MPGTNASIDSEFTTFLWLKSKKINQNIKINFLRGHNVKYLDPLLNTQIKCFKCC